MHSNTFRDDPQLARSSASSLSLPPMMREDPHVIGAAVDRDGGVEVGCMQDDE